VKKILLLAALSISILQCGPDGMDNELEITLPVSIDQIKPASIEEFLTSTATVSAIKTVQVKSEVNGFYQRVTNSTTNNPFAIGDQVSAGQTVIILDNPEYENNIKIESQKLNLDISEREYEKQKSLYDKGGVTLRELKNSERTYIEAKYTYENAQIQLSKLQIQAPFTGVIVDLPYHTKGSRLETNQLMFELMNYSQLYAEVFFPAKELGRIKPGQEIRATHYNLPGDTLNGKIGNVSPAINSESRSFKATPLIQNPNLVLRPGMFVQIETIVARKDSAVVIPKDIILSKRRGKTVFVVEKGAAFEKVIDIGIENNQQVEVLDGLKGLL